MKHATDEQILSVIDHFGGCRTGTIACKFLDDTAAIYRRMKRLERHGIVARHPTFTYPTDIYWIRTKNP